MSELEWNDPRLARLIDRIVDRRVRKRMASLLPEPHYGTVVANDAGTSSSTVRFSRPGGDDDVPGIAWRQHGAPVLAARVRVMYWPATGERYIDDD